MKHLNEIIVKERDYLMPFILWVLSEKKGSVGKKELVYLIMESAGVSRRKAFYSLGRLEEMGVIEYLPEKKQFITYSEPRKQQTLSALDVLASMQS
jgi:hypothetical protein